jgi:general secretion pathway protein G
MQNMNGQERMNRMAKRIRQATRRGFTLIEILLVVAIIGMLVALVGVAVPKYLESTRKDAAKTQIRMLETALDSYNMKNGKYPASLDDVKEFLRGNELPMTPWNGEYQYSASSSQAGYSYEISCTAPDGTLIANYNMSKRHSSTTSGPP